MLLLSLLNLQVVVEAVVVSMMKNADSPSMSARKNGVNCVGKDFLDTTIGKTVAFHQPIIVNQYPEGQEHFPRYMIVPIFDHDKIAAVIGLAHKNTDYDDMDVWQITLLMNSVWTMVERKRVKRLYVKKRSGCGRPSLSVKDGIITTDRAVTLK